MALGEGLACCALDAGVVPDGWVELVFGGLLLDEGYGGVAEERRGCGWGVGVGGVGAVVWEVAFVVCFWGAG